MIVNEKIGMYTEDEILEHLTEGEGREFLGRSMYDAIFDKIHALKTENEQLQQENAQLKDRIDKANKLIESEIEYKEGAEIYQWVDIRFEILEPIREILKGE